MDFFFIKGLLKPMSGDGIEVNLIQLQQGLLKQMSGAGACECSYAVGKVDTKTVPIFLMLFYILM